MGAQLRASNGLRPEAATAVNNAAVVIDPTAHVFPGHSSDAG